MTESDKKTEYLGGNLPQKERGLVYVFTGEGKGKTSAAIGVSVRMLLLDKKVVWISWYKSTTWSIAEKKLLGKFDNLKMVFGGEGFYIKEARSAKVNEAVVFDLKTPKEHETSAKRLVDMVVKILKNKNTEEIDLLVLDEINQTVKDGLLGIDQIRSILKHRGETHIVMTGRSFPKELESEVDLITEMKKNKHPYDKGIMAVRGLDF